MSDKKARQYFEEKDLDLRIKKIEVENHQIHYADIGDEQLPAVIFFHGAPGGWNAFIDFMSNPALLQVTRMISVDRPGYGYSGYGDPITSLQRQCELLKPILEEVRDQKTILVGHSLGGPIVARLAMEYPDLVNGLIMVGPSIDPEMEKDEWYRYIFRSALGRLLLPGSFWSTNEEIFFLKEELAAMLPMWQKIKMPVIVIQGTEDTLVPKENAFFAQKMIDSNYLDIWLEAGVNHFIPWNRPDLIEKAILKQLDQIVDTNEVSIY